MVNINLSMYIKYASTLIYPAKCNINLSFINQTIYFNIYLSIYTFFCSYYQPIHQLEKLFINLANYSQIYSPSLYCTILLSTYIFTSSSIDLTTHLSAPFVTYSYIKQFIAYISHNISDTQLNEFHSLSLTGGSSVPRA